MKDILSCMSQFKLIVLEFSALLVETEALVVEADSKEVLLLS